MRQGDASVRGGGRSSVENVGKPGRAAGATGGRLLQDRQLHRDSGSHWAPGQSGSEGGQGAGGRRSAEAARRGAQSRVCASGM